MRAARSIRNLARLAVATALTLSAAGAASAAGPVVFVDQGNKWGPGTRDEFYSRDQGSRVIRLVWLKALKTDDNKPFLWDGLARYGYLPNPASPSGLPVGFMTAGPTSRLDFAMNCSACHTRRIIVKGTEYRIDGGPALVDFQSFFVDLVAAVGRVLASDAAFAEFAAAVPGAGPQLKVDVSNWYQREHAMVEGSLKGGIDWGFGRLDAVSMIFNRLTGTDIGSGSSSLIVENIQPAKAPVRYPFLWNAPVQDRTQWPGFARNGNDFYGLLRNLGQVYGVFAIFRPRRAFDRVDFMTDNSTNWPGLDRMEQLVQRIGWPRWPWGYDPVLAGRGGEVFKGSCASCHGITDGPVRLTDEFPFFKKTWNTPLCDVGTDTMQYEILARGAKTGVYEGVKVPFGATFGENATAFDLLGVSVIGSIIQHEFGISVFSYASAAAAGTLPKTGSKLRQDLIKDLLDAYAPPTPRECGKEGGTHKYESRVLQGIWAAAPYLHNGSVPTLADLLKPGEDRPKSFRLGWQYSSDLVGLARDQGGSTYVRETTCDRQEGNSRCGHEYGTKLSDSDKRALLEYLKSI
jgi:processive rubber oxygenase RoxA-like protein